VNPAARDFFDHSVTVPIIGAAVFFSAKPVRAILRNSFRPGLNPGSAVRGWCTSSCANFALSWQTRTSATHKPIMRWQGRRLLRLFRRGYCGPLVGRASPTPTARMDDLRMTRPHRSSPLWLPAEICHSRPAMRVILRNSFRPGLNPGSVVRGWCTSSCANFALSWQTRTSATHNRRNRNVIPRTTLENFLNVIAEES